jgi:hypothetical protein
MRDLKWFRSLGKRDFANGAVLNDIDEVFRYAAAKLEEPAPSTTGNTANTAIGLLRAVVFHIDEIKFGCLKGLESDIREWAAQQQ